MKKLIIFLLFIWAPGLSYSQIFEDITAQQADSMIQANATNPNFVILDVRSPNEYFPEHLEGAIMRNYYDNDFEEQLDSLPKHKLYLLHCKAGGRSAQAHNIMFDLGFDEVYNMLGGINAWKNSGLPITDTFAPVIMMASDTLIELEEIQLGTIDTIELIVTNRGNALLIFEEICSMDHTEFSTDFDPSNTLEGAFDYTFHIFYEPVDEEMDSLSFCIDSEVGSVEVTILRTGIDETSGIATATYPNPGILFYPNPLKDQLTIELLEPGIMEMAILGLDGNRVMQLPVNRHCICDLDDLEGGQYLLRVQYEDRVEHHILVKGR